jgi:DNA-binding SARP family transcriptional activator
VQFGILGPVEADDGGRRLALGSPQQRALLADLLLHANVVMPRDRLVDDLWGDAPPDTAAKIVQLYVSALRKAIDPDRRRLLTEAPG